MLGSIFYTVRCTDPNVHMSSVRTQDCMKQHSRVAPYRAVTPMSQLGASIFFCGKTPLSTQSLLSSQLPAVCSLNRGCRLPQAGPRLQTESRHLKSYRCFDGWQPAVICYNSASERMQTRNSSAVLAVRAWTSSL